jgi:hypothetical protein
MATDWVEAGDKTPAYCHVLGYIAAIAQQHNECRFCCWTLRTRDFHGFATEPATGIMPFLTEG